ncbi:MAG: hypothetical protein NUV47_00470 [Patescibacteria group bacterium]|nr:hypothetical protein [Patescibacteria group bacterium]
MNINIRGIRVDKLLVADVLPVLPVFFSSWRWKGQKDDLNENIKAMHIAEISLFISVGFSAVVTLSIYLFFYGLISENGFMWIISVGIIIISISLLFGLIASLINIGLLIQFTNVVNRLDYLLQQCGINRGIAELPPGRESMTVKISNLLQANVLVIRRREIEDMEDLADSLRVNLRVISKILRENFDLPIAPFGPMFEEADKIIRAEKSEVI